ncbi:MAG: hypothetical protein LJE96_16250 [Deltaproteobacteria bacterium]|nr:hypothetical protein [Deltaproteobacteria bacterium]
MPSSIFSLASYKEGIHRAHKAGYITYADSYVPESGEMQFSNHISWDINGIHYEGGLSFTNTRHLFDGIRLVLAYFEDNPLTFLELGPGAGNACYELSCLAKTMNMDVKIHTASYTPVNPYMTLVRSGDELLASLSSNPHLKIMEKGPNGCSWYILDEDVFRMPHEALDQIYRKLDDPYIHHQYIGYYPRDIDLPSAGFDIIYDMFGPLHRKDVASIVDAYSRLSETGMLFFVFHERYAPGKIMLEGAKKRFTPIFNPKDTVVVDTQHYRAMVARENNPLARHFRKKFKSEFQTFEAHDMMGFLKWLQGDL